ASHEIRKCLFEHVSPHISRSIRIHLPILEVPEPAAECVDGRVAAIGGILGNFPFSILLERVGKIVEIGFETLHEPVDGPPLRGVEKTSGKRSGNMKTSLATGQCGGI